MKVDSKLNERLLKLNLSHSIIPRTCMDWNYWFWYADASENPNVTVTQKYLHMEHEEKPKANDDEDWNRTVTMCYVIGTIVMIGFIPVLVLILTLIGSHVK